MAKTNSFFDESKRAYRTDHEVTCRELYECLDSREFLRSVFERMAKSLADKLLSELNPAINAALEKMKKGGLSDGAN